MKVGFLAAENMKIVVKVKIVRDSEIIIII